MSSRRPAERGRVSPPPQRQQVGAEAPGRAGTSRRASPRALAGGSTTGDGGQNTTATTEVLGFRVDALTVGYTVQLDDATIRALEAACAEARKHRVRTVAFTVGPFPFMLSTKRARSGSFHLRNEDVTVLVGLNGEGPWDVEVDWRAIALATKGHAACAGLGSDIAKALRHFTPHSTVRVPARPPIRERLRRLDLCADVTGLSHSGRKGGATCEQACGVVLSALAAEGALPAGCSEQTVIREVSRAFERVVAERHTGKQLLLRVNAYLCLKAEMNDGERNGGRPGVAARAELQKQPAAGNVAA